MQSRDLASCATLVEPGSQRPRIGRLERVHNAQVDDFATQNEQCAYTEDLGPFRLRRGTHPMNRTVHGY